MGVTRCDRLRAGVISALTLLAASGYAVDDRQYPVGTNGLPSSPLKAPVAMTSGSFLPAGEMTGNLDAARRASRDSSVVHSVVQFAEVPGRDQRAQLESLGVKLVGYLPAKSYFASIPKSVTPAQLQAAGIHWCGSVYAGDKIAPRIRQTGVGAWARRPGGSAELVVKYFSDVAADSVVRSLEREGATVLRSSSASHRVTIEVPTNRIERLAGIDGVRWIEETPPPPRKHNDGSRVNTQASIVQAAPFSLTGEGVVLGIWDGGSVDDTHDDFNGRLLLGEQVDTDDHATHVAGTMAGDGFLSEAEGGTDRQWRGMATEATIISYDFNGDTIEEHNPAINTFGIVLSQNSWGFVVSEIFNNCDQFGDYASLAPEYDQITTGLFGAPVSVIFSAGNERNNGECGLDQGSPDFLNYRCIGPPSTAKNMIVVGAINSDDSSMTTFSSWGPTDDGRLKPDLVAPGDELGGEGAIRSTLPGDEYGLFVGTSMAAPAVSGCVALLIEDFRVQNNGADPLPSTVKALFIHTARDLDDASSFYNKGPDYASGYGRIQVRDAVNQMRDNGFIVDSVPNNASNSTPFVVPAGTTNVKVTLVWDDPAAAENASVALVNDLDLVVLDPNGVRHFPWALDPESPASDAVQTHEDHTNNVEQVQVEGTNVLSGVWTVQVVGTSVTVDAPQSYTLAFTPTAGIPSPDSVAIVATPFSDVGGGNGNGFIEEGETITVDVILTRPSTPSNTLTGVTGELSTTSDGVTVTQPSSAYPDIDAGAVVTNVTSFQIAVGSNAVCGSQINLTLTVQTDTGDAELDFVLDVGTVSQSVSIDFETGLGAIVIQNDGGGLWHLSQGRSAQVGHSSSNSLYYGQGETSAGGGNYHTAPTNGFANTSTANRGSFTLPSVNLVGLQGRAVLTFNHFLSRESSAPSSFDVAKVEISRDGGVTYHTAGGPYNSTDGDFERATIDLTPYRNHEIVIRFSFDTMDNQFNTPEGWYVDDIVIRSFDCPLQVNPPGRIVAQGTTVIDGDGVVTVNDGLSGSNLFTQTVLTGAPHSDFRTFPAATDTSGFQDIAVVAVRNTGTLDFEVRDGETGDLISSGSLSALLSDPYDAIGVDVAGTTADELVFVAAGAAGTTLDVRDSASGVSLYSVAVLDAAAYSSYSLVGADVDGDGDKDIIVIGTRAADGALVADVRAGDDGASIALFALGKKLAAPFTPSVGDVDGDGREELIVLASGAKGATLAVFDGRKGKQVFARKVLKNATNSAGLLTGRFLGAGISGCAIGATGPGGDIRIETVSSRGKVVNSTTLGHPVEAPFVAVAGDVNGDGRDDVLLVTQNAWDGSLLLLALDANTGGTYYTVTPFPGETVTDLNVFTADVDGDGSLDAVLSATRTADSEVIFEVRAGVSGALLSGFGQGSNFAGPDTAFSANVGE